MKSWEYCYECVCMLVCVYEKMLLIVQYGYERKQWRTDSCQTGQVEGERCGSESPKQRREAHHLTGGWFLAAPCSLLLMGVAVPFMCHCNCI